MSYINYQDKDDFEIIEGDIELNDSGVPAFYYPVKDGFVSISRDQAKAIFLELDDVFENQGRR